MQVGSFGGISLQLIAAAGKARLAPLRGRLSPPWG